MNIFYKSDDCTLYQGKMQDVLDTLPENSIDAIVCDPPYELNFMNKGWDNSGIAFQKDTWRKCYDVLKSGGYLLAFGGTRTYHRIACAIEDAGFEIRDCIMWLYGSGFPKSLDISKAIDKRGGTSISWFGKYLKNILKEKNMSYNDLAKYFPSKTGGITGCVHNWIEGKNIPTIEQFNKICKILDLPFKEIEEIEREVIGKTITNKTIYQKIGDTNISGEIDITIPKSDLAKKWSGWGTALKPAYEPIIVARKPCEGSTTDNVIKYGVGGINIDECRIYGDDSISCHNTQKGTFAGKTQTMPKMTKDNDGIFKGRNAERIPYTQHEGRFPSNVILTYDDTDFNEVCGRMPNTKSIFNPEAKQETEIHRHSKDFMQWGYKQRIVNEYNSYNDSGSASRYFYCAKASKKDRDNGLDMFEEKEGHAKGNGLDRVCEFCGVSQLTPELCHCEVKSWVAKPKKNIHPTVKPVELMQYLVRLVSPKGATVLDCFMGSGSTGKAVMFENRERNANYKFIGIELTDEYLPIAKARIDYAKDIFEYELKQKKKEGQLNIFDFMGEE